MLQVEIELIRGGFTLIAVALGSFIGFQVFFQQKEYELIKQRYLENGVDVIATEIEAAIGAVSHNWARCIQLCRSFRALETSFDLKELDKGFIDLETKNFHQIAHHRVTSLIQSEVIWHIFQIALAELGSTNEEISKEIPEAIRLRCTTSLITEKPKKMAEKMLEDLVPLLERTHKYATLIRELHTLSLMLESARLNVSTVAKFSKRKDVKELIARLHVDFPEEPKP